MRARLWDTEVANAQNSSRRRQLLFELAQYLADKEELKRALIQLEDWLAEIRSLESAGWLLRTGGISASIGFVISRCSITSMCGGCSRKTKMSRRPSSRTSGSLFVVSKSDIGVPSRIGS